MTPAGIEPATFRFVAQHLNHCATAVPTRRGHKPKSTNYPDHGHHANLPLQGKIFMVEPGIEPGTSWLVVRDPDH